eukprot:gnl/TRDRNA2_/TRDRNA2_165009_c0_seq5.p1 gnl/TRDRNA2_/TRDRNA2_165009_c0~~gnl/TRDRNA2_/TRDRNA2_165009_c0_seq5.p1  ORF type:complete len:309 (-),score=36.21 gnl/TRDRNA2_/TRDRNA2_165009_c0_seq5:50-976(-)
MEITLRTQGHDGGLGLRTEGASNRILLQAESIEHAASSNATRLDLGSSGRLSWCSMRCLCAGPRPKPKPRAEAWHSWLIASDATASCLVSSLESSIAQSIGSKNAAIASSSSTDSEGADYSKIQEKEPAIMSPCDGEDCPICYEAISAGAAAMRCAGTSGVHHYFHKECLGTWIGSCRTMLQSPTCPVCRGNVQVNIHTLAAFLESPQAACLEQQERGALEIFLARSRATICGSMLAEEDAVWADPFTVEEMSYVGMIGLATSAGFWAGFAEGGLDDLILITFQPGGCARLAFGAGFMSGITCAGLFS